MMHKSVLLKEIISFFEPKPNENFIDATFGDGGHAIEILKHTAPEGKILAIDWDKKAIESFDGHGLDTRSIFKYASEPQQIAPAEASEQDRSGVERASVSNAARLILACGNFADIHKIAGSVNFKGAKGVLFDFGFRTFHIEESGRGFSFQKNEPLDMRYNITRTDADQTRIGSDNSLTAGEIINERPERDLERIFREYGEERNSKKIARAIVESRRSASIKTTGELAEIIKKETASNAIKTLARIFQALRIAVNNELENIKLGLEGAWDIIAP